MYVCHICPNSRDYGSPFSIEKSSRAALEGAWKERSGSRGKYSGSNEEHQGAQESIGGARGSRVGSKGEQKDEIGLSAGVMRRWHMFEIRECYGL